MSVIQVQKGTTAIRTFETLSRENGTRTAPSALPTVMSAHVNGTINSVLQAAATIALMQDATPSNITGYYRLEFSTATSVINDDIDIVVTATILGTVVVQVLRFLVIDVPSTIPVIR